MSRSCWWTPRASQARRVNGSRTCCGAATTLRSGSLPRRYRRRLVPRTLLVGALASTLLAWGWLRLEEGTSAAQAALVVALALVPALVPGARRRAAATAVAAGSALELAFGWSYPGRILSRFGSGFLDFYKVQVPFDPSSHPRMHGVLLVALFVFTLWVGLAAAVRRPGLASAGLVVGAGWPGTLLPGHD